MSVHTHRYVHTHAIRLTCEERSLDATRTLSDTIGKAFPFSRRYTSDEIPMKDHAKRRQRRRQKRKRKKVLTRRPLGRGAGACL